MTEYSALVTAIIAALVALVVAYWKRPKDTADAIAVYQKIAYDAMAQVERINDELKEERKSREEEKRGERLSREAEIKDLQRQIEEIRTSKDMVIGGLTNKVNSLERENIQLREMVISLGGRMDKLNKKVTGQLPPR